MSVLNQISSATHKHLENMRQVYLFLLEEAKSKRSIKYSAMYRFYKSAAKSVPALAYRLEKQGIAIRAGSRDCSLIVFTDKRRLIQAIEEINTEYSRRMLAGHYLDDDKTDPALEKILDEMHKTQSEETPDCARNLDFISSVLFKPPQRAQHG